MVLLCLVLLNSMITVVEGRPGMGKSVWLVAEILRWLRAGKTVYTNIWISDQVLVEKYGDRLIYIDSMDDIIELREGKIILDEVQTYLNSRKWDSLPVEMQLLLQQHRKRGLDIIGATQSIKRADVVFRELVQVFYRIKKIVAFRLPYSKLAFGFFYIREFDPDDMESGGAKSNQKALSWPLPFVVDPFTFSIYDTTQEYAPMNRKGERVLKEFVMTEKTTLEPVLVGSRRVPQASSP